MTIDYYRNHAEALANRYELADVSAVQQQLLSTFPPGSRLLEVGCGSGRDAAFMVNHGYDVMAVDGAQEMLDAAVEHHPELAGRTRAVLLPDGLSSPLGVFDGMYSIAVLMHLSQPDIFSSLCNVQKLLNPHGLFFFSVPTRRSDVDENGLDDKGRRFTILPLETWKDLCKKAGFRFHQHTFSTDGLGRDSVKWLNAVVEKGDD